MIFFVLDKKNEYGHVDSFKVPIGLLFHLSEDTCSGCCQHVCTYSTGCLRGSGEVFCLAKYFHWQFVGIPDESSSSLS
jgi:hypothetical protein